MTIAIVWLLNVPGLLLIGGLLLVWIAYKLLAPVQAEKKHGELSGSRVGLWAAIRTIIVADAVMGMDNVLGVAGAAHGDFLLVVLGLLISVPIMVLGSTLILKWVERYPVIIYIGAGVLAWTAATMISNEAIVQEYLLENRVVEWLLYGLIVGGVVLSGLLRNAPIKSTRGEATPRHP